MASNAKHLQRVGKMLIVREELLLEAAEFLRNGAPIHPGSVLGNAIVILADKISRRIADEAPDAR